MLLRVTPIKSSSLRILSLLVPYLFFPMLFLFCFFLSSFFMIRRSFVFFFFFFFYFDFFYLNFMLLGKSFFFLLFFPLFMPRPRPTPFGQRALLFDAKFASRSFHRGISLRRRAGRFRERLQLLAFPWGSAFDPGPNRSPWFTTIPQRSSSHCWQTTFNSLAVVPSGVKGAHC